MSVTFKKDTWKIKDPNTGEYRDSTVFASTFAQDTSNIVAEATAAIDAQETRAAGIVSGAQSDIDTIATAVQSMTQTGTDTTLTVSGAAADAAAVGELKTTITQNNVAVENISNNSAEKKTLSAWGMRSTFDGTFTKVNMPSGFTYLSNVNVDLYSDGYKFKCYTDLATLKNESNATHTVTPSTIATELANATAGDTLILDDGVYAPIEINKSINIIARNTGKVLFVPLVPQGGFTATLTAGAYKTTISATPSSIYDITRISDGIIRRLSKKTNSSDLVNPGTWYKSGSTLYVHLFEGNLPTDYDIACVSSVTATIDCTPSANNKVYIEGVNIFGGQINIYYPNTSTYTSQKLIMKNCKMYYSTTANAVQLEGVDGFFQNCECVHALRDGFNYHSQNNIASNGLEINCIAHDCGTDATSSQTSNNGTTMHDGGKAVRINGIYYNNYGANVADISTNTETYNYGCVAFDSKAIVDEESGDFWTSSSSQCNMYLYGCKAIGDKTKYNIYADNGTIHISNTEYDTKTGTVVDI